MSSTSSPPKWVLQINDPSPPRAKNTSVIDPPGFSATAIAKTGGKGRSVVASKASKAPSTEEMDTLKLKKAWEVAIAPAKSLPMNAVGMYMSGNSLQIFSIMMVFMLFKTPVTSILNLNTTFKNFETEGTKSRLLGVKLVFIACNLLALGLGIWKVNGMGLLPTTRSDWLAWESPREPLYNLRTHLDSTL